jgi:hypothetical protein
MRGADTERYQGAATHPAIGASPARVGPEVRAAHREQARDKTPEGAGSLNTSHSHVGPVLGLGPMPSHLAVVDSRASCVELRHPAGKPVRRRVPRFGIAACATARTRSPSRLSATGLPDEVPDRKRRATRQATGGRGDPKVASRGVPTEVGPEAQDTQREHNDTSHGVRFLSAR